MLRANNSANSKRTSRGEGGRSVWLKDHLFARVIENHFVAMKDAHSDMAGERFVHRGTFLEKIGLRFFDIGFSETQDRNGSAFRFDAAADAKLGARPAFDRFEKFVFAHEF